MKRREGERTKANTEMNKKKKEPSQGTEKETTNGSDTNSDEEVGRAQK